MLPRSTTTLWTSLHESRLSEALSQRSRLSPLQPSWPHRALRLRRAPPSRLTAEHGKNREAQGAYELLQSPLRGLSRRPEHDTRYRYSGARAEPQRDLSKISVNSRLAPANRSYPHEGDR